ncbi:mCG8840, partial [Mus musculus]
DIECSDQLKLKQAFGIIYNPERDKADPRGLKAMGDVEGAEESSWKDQQETDRVRFLECLVYVPGWRRHPWPCRGSVLVGKQTQPTLGPWFPCKKPSGFLEDTFPGGSDSRAA